MSDLPFHKTEIKGDKQKEWKNTNHFAEIIWQQQMLERVLHLYVRLWQRDHLRQQLSNVQVLQLKPLLGTLQMQVDTGGGIYEGVLLFDWL